MNRAMRLAVIYVCLYGASGMGSAIHAQDASDFQLLHAFGGTSLSKPTYITQARDGRLWVTAEAGGELLAGGVARITVGADGNHITEVFPSDFFVERPAGPLVEGPGGEMYGITHGFGYSSSDAFRVELDGTVVRIRSFNGGFAESGFVLGSDGWLYGTANNGSLYRLSTDGTSFETLHYFNTNTEGCPTGNLSIAPDGTIYGTTSSCGSFLGGTLFALSDGVTHTLATFDGAPASGPAVGPDGSIYWAGDDYFPDDGYCGAIHKYVPGSGTEAVIYYFDCQGAYFPFGMLTVAADGTLFGVTKDGGAGQGVVFSLGIDGTFTVIDSLQFFYGFEENRRGQIVVMPDGRLWSAALYGDNVFSVGAGGYRREVQLNQLPLPRNLEGGLVQGRDGLWYGTSRNGGDFDRGTLFRIAADGSGYQLLHSFIAGIDDGSFPIGGLVRATDGVLYGRTESDGPGGHGAMFRVTPSGTLEFMEQTRLDQVPLGPLASGPNGALYASTPTLGPYQPVNIVKWTAGESSFRQMAIVPQEIGYVLYGALAVDSDGAVYAVGIGGSQYNLLRVDPDRTVTIVHTFDTEYPAAGVVIGLDGRLYGTSPGANPNAGILFSVAKDGSGYHTVQLFTIDMGLWTNAPLTVGLDGNLYGTAGTNCVEDPLQHCYDNSIFRYNAASGIEVLHRFDARTEGRTVESALNTGLDGYLYGVLKNEGPRGFGALFRHNAHIVAPPIARATASPNPVEADAPDGAEVMLSGETSSDPENDPLTYNWTWAGGSNDSVSFAARFPVGTTPVTLTVTDDKVHSASTTIDVVVTDHGAPFFLYLAVPDGNLDFNTDPPHLSVPATSQAGKQVSFDPVFYDAIDGEFIGSCLRPSGSLFPKGTTLVTCVGSDRSGNSASMLFSVIVTNRAPYSDNYWFEADAGKELLVEAPGVMIYAFDEDAGVPLPVPGLRHRWSFSHDGSDSVGGALGTFTNVSPDATAVAFNNGSLSSDDLAAQFVTLPVIGESTTVNDTTLEWWFTPQASSTPAPLFAIGEEFSDRLWLTPNGSDTGGPQVSWVKDHTLTRFGSSTPLAPGVPAHAVLTLDHQAGAMTFYVNGIAVASKSTSVPSNLRRIGSQMFLGRGLSGSDPAFTGALDEFRIYDRVLSAEEVAADFATGPDAVQYSGLTAQLRRPPWYGSVVLNPDGSFSYTSHVGFNGQDSFTYVLTDGEGESSEGTVTINVTYRNQPPVADQQSIEMLEGTTQRIVLTVSDPDDDPLTINLNSGSQHGSLTQDPQGNGTIWHYTPFAGYSGPDELEFYVEDGRFGRAVAGVNITVIADTDGDGIGNPVDPDDDNDGAPDVGDALPLDPTETLDADHDGIGNNADPDDDNDGVADVADAFPFNAAESVDTDHDGIGNNADTDDDDDGVADGSDSFPLNAAESVDTDSDGIGNNADTDDDNDGVADGDDAFPRNAAESVDTDSDGIGNNADTDDDDDGVADGNDAFPLNVAESVDTDSDGIGNNADTDDDNDGVADGTDAFPLDAAESIDTDADGIGNNADTDDDADGVADASDAFPLNAAESIDTDGDGIGNNADTDDDNDGTPDVSDALPLDPTETLDADHDGIGNNADPDDDNDGVADGSDAFPLNASESVDTDHDGTGNNADTDDDNDTVADASDAFPLNAAESVDTDHDGIGNNADTDDDNDNVADGSDAFPLNASESVDTDHDGIGNNADTDDDNDTVADATDAFPLDAAESVDTDHDGIGNNADTDDDNDAFLDGDDNCPLVPGPDEGCPPTPPGRMRGNGDIDTTNPVRHNEFDFTVNERVSGPDSGRLRVRIRERRQGRDDIDRFISRAVTSIVFGDNPNVSPGKRPPSGVDTVIITGTGDWNGAPNHTYVVEASDRGEPGRGRDTFAITIRAPGGAVVASFDGTLSGGNIQSTKAKK